MYAAFITGPSTAVSRWLSFFIRSKMYPQRQNVFLSNSRRLAAPRTWLHVLKPKRLSLSPPPPPPPPPHSSLLLRVSYSLSLICQPDIRGHEAPHHHHTWNMHSPDDPTSTAKRRQTCTRLGTISATQTCNAAIHGPWTHLMIENQIQRASKTGFYWKVCENKWVFNCDLNQKTTVQQTASRYHLSNSSRPIRDGYSSVDTASAWKAGRNNDADSSHQSGKGSPSSADSLTVSVQLPCAIACIDFSLSAL